MSYQPKTGAQCSCKRGVQRDNCPACEGTGWVIDFAAIRRRVAEPTPVVRHTPAPWRLHRSSIKSAAGATIARVVEGWGASGDEARANARLIVEAPAMVATIENLLTVVAMLPGPNAVTIEARALLARINGEA